MTTPASALRYVAPLVLLGASVGSASYALADSRPVQFPQAADASDMQQVWPEEVGVDSRDLVKLSEWIRQKNYDVRSFVVVKDGKIVFERYSSGLSRANNYELYSITKGVTSLTAGILIDEGKAHLDDAMSTVIGKWRPELKQYLADKQDIKLRHVLTMSTGLFYDFKPPNDPIYYEAPDRLKLSVDTKPEFPPGTVFQYTDINPIIAAAMLSAAAGEPLEKFAEEKLFKPLGMKDYQWDRADKSGLVSSGWGLRLRAVDMAKVGMLVLNGGKWQDKQIVSASWVKEMTSSGVVPYFGYYWWAHNIVEGGAEGGNQPEVDTMGFKGQFIVTLPKYNAVVVMTSMLPIEGGLRDAKCLQIMRYMVGQFVVPALENSDNVGLTDTAKKKLVDELQLAEDSKGIPGVGADPTDTPRQ